MQAMQRLEGLARKAMQLYRMVQPGDAVCVAVSGGKDSVALAVALRRLAAYFEHPFTLCALTIDPVFGGQETDYSPLTAYLQAQGIEHRVQRSDIGRLVFEVRQEKNPCALCAKMRRGALHTAAKELGCNKIAFGHHLDDAIETFYMNLLGEGRLGCFSPVTHLSRKDITLIRPLVLAEESEVAHAARRLALPVVKNPCPVDGATARADMKRFVAGQVRRDAAFRQKMLGALQKAGLDGWAPLAATGRAAKKQQNNAEQENEE